MTYALAWPLQQAVYATLSTAPEVVALAGDRIHDAGPQIDGQLAAEGPSITIGDEEVKDWSCASAGGAEHMLRITVNAARAGFAEAKQLAGAISDRLLASELSLSRGTVALLVFVGAKTDRSEDDRLRRIALSFRVLVEDTP